MKKLVKSFFIVFVSILIVSCATVREPIATVKKPTLSQDEIKNLETKEELAVEAKYRTLINQQIIDTIHQPRVSNIYVDMDIRAALMDLSTQTGINIIPDNTVEGSVSLSLENVPLEKAFDMILYPGGYEYHYVEAGKYYIVGKSLPENSSFDALTITKTIKTNRGADKVLSQLSNYYQSFVKADGQVITITATPNIANRLERDIALIDKAKRLVEISAQFVMVEWSKGTNLGMQWGDLNLSAAGISDILKGGTTASVNLASGLTAFLSSNGYDAKIKTIAEPRIVVEDGEKAELNITEEHLFLILSGGGAAYNYFTTKEVSVGIKLKVQPFVTREDGQIRLTVNPEVADIIGEREFKSNGGPSQKLPIIARRSTSTTLKIQNGETIAIGGLITKAEQTKRSGIPFFRQIPLIGFIFGNKNEAKKETELVIFLTPKVIG